MQKLQRACKAQKKKEESPIGNSVATKLGLVSCYAWPWCKPIQAPP